MDPISQGTVGAAFAQSSANRGNIVKIGFIGFLAGLAPDLDVLIRSETDPILFLEYHRQFSHSLFFIPLGSLIVALFIFPFVKGSMTLKTVYIASFLVNMWGWGIYYIHTHIIFFCRYTYIRHRSRENKLKDTLS